jgi:hypothetical protein
LLNFTPKIPCFSIPFLIDKAQGMVFTARTRQNMPFRTILAGRADKSDNSSGFPTLFRRHPMLHVHNKKDVKSGIYNS